MPDDPNAMQREIQRLEELVPTLEERLDSVYALAVEDGEIEPHEQRAIDGVKDKIKAAKDKIGEMKVELDEMNGITSFEDDPEIITVEMLPYDHRDFVGAFEQSVKDWTQDSAIGLNSVRTYMIERKEPAGVSVSDVLTVCALFTPAAGHMKTALEILDIAKRAFEQELRRSRGATPSLNEIHVSWSNAVAAMRKGENLKKAFPIWVEQYKKDNDIPSDVDVAVANLFEAECRNFAENNMPSTETIQKAFVSHIINKTVQDEDWIGEGDEISGWAIIDCTANGGIDEDALPVPVRGYMDDVPKDLMQAFSTVYKGERVYNVPVKIQFHVRNNMGAGHTIIERNNTTPGNTSFKMKSGEDAFYKAFMANKVWERAGVNMLKADG